MIRWIVTLVIAIQVVANGSALAENDRESKIAKDKERFEGLTDWIYNDVDKAFAESKKTGKPIMAVLRCIPCEECVKLDDDLIDNDPAISPLMSKFVRLRLTSTNGLDLATFQYDTDQSFAVFFLNADKVVYGRFGTRSHRTEWVTDVSVEGMAQAMEGALQLHGRYPANRSQLAAKSGQPTLFSTPEQFPTLRKKPGKLNWQGRDFAKVAAAKCIHCHEISEARMEVYWKKAEPIPEKVLYPYPHPKSIGLVLDPKHRARVEEVVDDSPAAVAGLASGDDILRMNGQPLISMADVQWVLHHLPAEGENVKLLVRRNSELRELTIKLKDGWRSVDDTSWRTGHWILRRSMLGGMMLSGGSAAKPPERLEVESIGKWGPFGAAKRAGAMKGDIVVAVDGQKGFERESDVFDYVNRNKTSGDSLELTLERDGKPVTVKFQVR